MRPISFRTALVRCDAVSTKFLKILTYTRDKLKVQPTISKYSKYDMNINKNMHNFSFAIFDATVSNLRNSNKLEYLGTWLYEKIFSNLTFYK